MWPLGLLSSTLPLSHCAPMTDCDMSRQSNQRHNIQLNVYKDLSYYLLHIPLKAHCVMYFFLISLLTCVLVLIWLAYVTFSSYVTVSCVDSLHT